MHPEISPAAVDAKVTRDQMERFPFEAMRCSWKPPFPMLPVVQRDWRVEYPSTVRWFDLCRKTPCRQDLWFVLSSADWDLLKLDNISIWKIPCASNSVVTNTCLELLKFQWVSSMPVIAPGYVQLDHEIWHTTMNRLRIYLSVGAQGAPGGVSSVRVKVGSAACSYGYLLSILFMGNLKSSERNEGRNGPSFKVCRTWQVSSSHLASLIGSIGMV